MHAEGAAFFLGLSVTPLVSGPRPAGSNDPPAWFTISTLRADDAVPVGGDWERTVFAIESPAGISRAGGERTCDAWPKAVVVRLHLTGLENSKVSVGAAAGVRDGRVRDR